MRVGLAGLVMALVAGCVQSSSVICGDRVCPESTVCAELVNVTGEPHRCVPQDARDACNGVDALAGCMYGDVTMGACYTTTDGEVCLASGCGNSLLDNGEVCDDGNADIGDGCSQACLSNETCGNGVVDPIKLDDAKHAIPNELCDDANFVGHDACNTCQPELAGWMSTLPEIPDGRLSTAISFDPIRRRFVMFGGEVRTGTDTSPDNPFPLGDTWESDGSSWLRMHPELSPSTRTGIAMTYDAATKTSVLFGGNDGAPRNDTWEWDGTRWKLDGLDASPAETPAPRSYAGLAYDSKRKVVVLVGGTGSTDALSDTWEWNGTKWTEMAPTVSPGKQPRPAVTYDPIRGVVVMVGVSATNVPATWEYDGTTWTSKDTTNTPSATTGMAAYDAVRHQVIVYATRTTFNTYGWNGTTWSDLSATQAGVVAGATLASDPKTGHVLLFGGRKTSCITQNCFYTSRNETWIWNGTLWAQVSQQSNLTPDPRFNAKAVLDTHHNAVVLVGGTVYGNTAYNDTWQLDGLTWTKFANQPWAQPRGDEALAYDSTRDEVVVFGGLDADSSTVYGDTYVRKNGSWSAKTTPPALTARAGAAMAYDAERAKTILFGGATATTFPTDTWAWNGTAWSQLSPANAPPARRGASFAWDPIRKQLVLFGGRGNGDYLGDTWTWDGTDWTDRTAPIGPPPREGSGMAWDAARGTIVLVNGVNHGGELSDTWEWNGAAWRSITATNAPPGRQEHVVVSAPDGAGIVIFGGQNGSSGPIGDQYRLRWDGDQVYEQCSITTDADGDGLKGCADPDCASSCQLCGDGTCNTAIENCHNCPGDCTCTPVCGDSFCDSGETQTTCPGDCTP